LHGKPKKKELAEFVAKETDLTVKMYGQNPNLPGSFEFIQYSLRSSARKHLMAHNVVDEYGGWCDLFATTASDAIVCHYRDGKSKCYRVSYSVGDDGEAKFVGEPKEVEIQPVVIEKYLADLQTKAGKTPRTLANELIATAAVSSDPAVLKALEDVAGFASMMRQQIEDKELAELIGLDQ
jgi:hypothetical protein